MANIIKIKDKSKVPDYSQGIVDEGTAILRDGVPMSPEQIVEQLNFSSFLIEHCRIIYFADSAILRKNFGSYPYEHYLSCNKDSEMHLKQIAEFKRISE